jgi:transcriptional regulator with XRE-family HTH domain
MRVSKATDLGAFIRERRDALGVSQGDLSQMAGIDQGNLSKIERGVSTATLETYLTLCQALGIDLSAEARA